MQYWLMKSEPACYSIQNLEEDGSTPWDGVRNYQARNFMRDEMQVGDKVLFYHSVTNPGIAGLAEISRTAYPDHTSWDPEDSHFDPKSTPENPRWFMVDVAFVKAFEKELPLKFLKTVPELSGMELLKKGSRLSVMPVSKEEYETIVALAEEQK